MKVSPRVFDAICIALVAGNMAALAVACFLSLAKEPVAPELWAIAGGVRLVQFFLQLHPHKD